jgi:hypothetical protein
MAGVLIVLHVPINQPNRKGVAKSRCCPLIAYAVSDIDGGPAFAKRPSISAKRRKGRPGRGTGIVQVP